MSFETKHFINRKQQLMYKQISETEVYLLQLLGKDMNVHFCHRHERVIFPSKERLAEDLLTMEPADDETWENLMSDFLSINKNKLAIWSDYRQKKYDAKHGIERGDPAQLVKYVDKNGKDQYGIAYKNDQTKAYQEVNKVMLVLTDEHFVRLKNERGGRIISLVLAEKLTLIGHID